MTLVWARKIATNFELICWLVSFEKIKIRDEILKHCNVNMTVLLNSIQIEFGLLKYFFRICANLTKVNFKLLCFLLKLISRVSAVWIVFLVKFWSEHVFHNIPIKMEDMSRYWKSTVLFRILSFTLSNYHDNPDLRPVWIFSMIGPLLIQDC